MIIDKLISIPVVGIIFAITNSYVSGGSIDSDTKFSSLKSWIKVVGIPFTTSLALSSWMLYPGIAAYLKNTDHKLVLGSFLMDPGSLLTGILPNVLGFGIGVYALVFSISARLVNDFNNRITQIDAKKTALVLNADMAFPLIVLLISICCGLIQKKFPDSLWAILIGWTALWYSLLMTLGLIGTLFRLGENELLNKIQHSRGSGE